jgi:HTH-type transcriptional regulator, cell division transcriptional repressor
MGILFTGIFYIIPLMDKNLVGLRVYKARKKAKPPITQKDLVARLQVIGMMIDQSGLSKIENRQRPVTDIEVVSLSKALNVPVDWLLGLSEKT